MARLLTSLIPFALAILASAPITHADDAWVVSAGDTLLSIAERSGVSVDDLRAWNAIEGDRIRIGQSLNVAAPGEGTDADKHEAEVPAQRAPTTGPTYKVKFGDTLGGIAQKNGATLADLLRLNPDVDPDRIREGQLLRVSESRRKVRYTIERGDRLSQIAARFEVSVAEIIRANPGLRPDRIREGRTLTIYTNVPDSRTESVGTPSEGKLLHAVRLTPHRGYLIRNRDRAFGTAELVHGVRKVFDKFVSRFPDAPRIEIHDLSLRKGGPMDDHRSHQSGRDIDIAYIFKGCKRKGCDFRRVRSNDLDVKKQWALLKPWLESRGAEAIFIDYSLQRVLYNEARRQGASRDELALWFQYPRGRTFPLGVIRHVRAHNDHMHVRVACDDTDSNCKTFRPLLMAAQHASR